MVGGAVSFASEGQRLSRTSRDSLRAVAVEEHAPSEEEAARGEHGGQAGGRGAAPADDGQPRADDLDPEVIPVQVDYGLACCVGILQIYLSL